MGISTRVVTLDSGGTASLHVAPCFYAGNDVDAAVGDSLAGVLNDNYTHATMPFIRGELSVTGPANSEVSIYFDFDA